MLSTGLAHTEMYTAVQRALQSVNVQYTLPPVKGGSSATGYGDSADQFRRKIGAIQSREDDVSGGQPQQQSLHSEHDMMYAGRRAAAGQALLLDPTGPEGAVEAKLEAGF